MYHTHTHTLYMTHTHRVTHPVTPTPTLSLGLVPSGFLLVVPLFRAAVRSYASAPWPRGPRYYLSFQELEVVFLPTASDGTLLYSQDSDTRDFLSVTLAGGHPELRFDCGSGTAVIRLAPPWRAATGARKRCTPETNGPHGQFL